MLVAVCLSGFQCWKTSGISFVDHPNYRNARFFSEVKAIVVGSGFEQSEQYESANIVVSVFTPIRISGDKIEDGGLTVHFDKHSGETTLRFSQIRPWTAEGKTRYRLVTELLKRKFGSEAVHAEAVDELGS